jgi:hypothetical protein
MSIIEKVPTAFLAICQRPGRLRHWSVRSVPAHPAQAHVLIGLNMLRPTHAGTSTNRPRPLGGRLISAPKFSGRHKILAGPYRPSSGLCHNMLNLEYRHKPLFYRYGPAINGQNLVPTRGFRCRYEPACA